MRHGHAQDGPDDYSRELTAEGERAVEAAGAALAARGAPWDVVLASSAPRAAHTARLVAKAAQFAGEVVLDRRLYLASPATYLHILQSVQCTATAVLLVGHNPGISTLVERLSGESCSLAPAQYSWLQLDVESWQALSGT